MASTCRDVITLALRIGKVSGVSGAPTAAEAELGLEALQSFYLDMAATGMFGSLRDVMAAADYTAKPGERVLVANSAVISLPETVLEGGQAFPPYDLSLIEVVDPVAGARQLKLYEAARGRWSELCGLTLDSDAPLVSRGAIGLAATFAVSGAFLVAFSASIDANLAPAVRTFRLGLIGKQGADRVRIADGYE